MAAHVEYAKGTLAPEQEFLRGEQITVVKLMEICEDDSYFRDQDLIGAIFVQNQLGGLGTWDDDGTFYLEEVRLIAPRDLARKYEGVTFSFHSVKLHHLFSF